MKKKNLSLSTNNVVSSGDNHSSEQTSKGKMTMKRNGTRSGKRVVPSGTSQGSTQTQIGDMTMKSSVSLSDSEMSIFRDELFKDILLDTARSGANKPAPDTILGDALIRFTTKTRTNSNRKPIEEVSVESIMNKLTDDEIIEKVNAILQEILLDMAKHGEDKPKPGTILGEALLRFTATDEDLKDMLIEMAENGEDRPKPGTVLGDALIRFTTKPKKG